MTGVSKLQDVEIIESEVDSLLLLKKTLTSTFSTTFFYMFDIITLPL